MSISTSIYDAPLGDKLPIPGSVPPGTESWNDNLGNDPIVLHLLPAINFSLDEYFEFASQNRDVRIERTKEGALEIMSPAGGKSGHRNAEITFQLQAWKKSNGKGLAFDSSTGWELPNGASLAPDASWITLEKWNSISDDQKEKFPPLCPDFVIELRSPSDRLTNVRKKMEEYISCGAKLGWLIDPLKKTVHIYRAGKDVEILAQPASVSGEDVLPGFTLQLAEIFI